MNNRTLVGQYAGFVTRAVGLIVDILVVIVTIFVLYWTISLPLIFFLGIEPSNCLTGQIRITTAYTRQTSTLICGAANIAWLLVTLGAAPVYFTFFVSATGQTIGHYLMGVRVVRLDGHRMTVWGSFVRYVGMILALIPVGLGYLWVLIDDRRQGWHDKLARTCVVYAWQAEQNEFTLDRVRNLIQQGRKAIEQRGVRNTHAAHTEGRAYDLVTIAFQDYDRLDNVLDLIQNNIVKGRITIVNATVLVKGAKGEIGVLGASDMATGNKLNRVSPADLDVPEYELKHILEDVPNDSFVVAVVLEEQWADELTKLVARAMPALIRRHDLGSSPLPAKAAATQRTAVAANKPVSLAARPVEAATRTTVSSTAASTPLPVSAVDSGAAPSGLAPQPTTTTSNANGHSTAAVAPTLSPQAGQPDAPSPAAPPSELSDLKDDVARLKQQLDSVVADRAASKDMVEEQINQPAVTPVAVPRQPVRQGNVEDQLAALNEKLDSALSANAAVNALVESQFNQQKASSPSVLMPVDELDEVKEQLAALGLKLDSALAERTALINELEEHSHAAAPATPPVVHPPLHLFQVAATASAADLGVASQTTATLQDLADVVHIGTVYEQRLYRAGVGTFWELAHVSDSDLARILKLTDLQKLTVDFDAVRADARRLAENSATIGRIWHGETPDDFEPIQGIGKVFEQRLYQAGIRTYRALAAAAPAQLADICQARKPLEPDYLSWIQQAQQLMIRTGSGTS